MELAAPPPELAALADPSARGAAPLLAASGGGGRAPPAAVPFELLFGLLAEPAAAGKPWPGAGKKLPLAQLGAAAESLPAFAMPSPSALSPPLLPEAADRPPAAPRPQTATSAMLPAEQWRAALAARTPMPAAATGADPFIGAAAADAFATERYAPVELVPTGDETAPLGLAVPNSADAAAAAEPALDGLEALFSNDARVRAELKSTAAAEPRPSAAPVLPPLASNAPLALGEAHAAGARAKAPGQLEVLRGVDSLAATTPLSAGSEVPTGVANEWLPSGHVHASHTNGAPGTAGSAAPALPQAPVDTRMPEWHEAFAQRVQWLVDTDAGEARIKLNPPELGAVDVKISLVDDKTHVHLTAATAAARDELAQSLPRLRELFTVSGLELGSASVADGRGGEHARPGGGEHAGHGNPAPRDPGIPSLPGVLDEPVLAARSSARGRIDVFA